MLGDPDRDRRQLRDLVAVWLPSGFSPTVAEVSSATRAALGPVIDDFIELRLGHELAGRSFVTGLGALLAGTRSTLRLRRLARRVGRRRAGGVLGVLAQLLLEALDPRLQAGDLALVAGGQLDQELDARLTTGVIDRLGFGALHAKGFARRRLCPPTGLNAYLKALVSSAFSQVRGLNDLVAGKAIAGERFDLRGAPAVPIECALDFAPQAGKRRVR